MSSATEQLLEFDPADLVGPDARLFIDTNVFMDTDRTRKGGLQQLFLRIDERVRSGGSPVVVPTKVMSELAKQSQADPSGEDEERAEAIKKAANALDFLEAATQRGLVRTNLGDGSNPYADDLFVDLFDAYAGKYAMALVTNDITLSLRINALGVRRNAWIVAGRLTTEGMIECSPPQALYERGLAKLRRIQKRIAEGRENAKDHLEVATLEVALSEFAEYFGAIASDEPESIPAVNAPAAAAPHGAPFSSTATFMGPDEVLAVIDVPGEGDEVVLTTLGESTVVRLGEKLGEGGEGSVYSISDTAVVKIFDASNITTHRRAKIELLVSRDLTAEGICFPQAVANNTHGEFVGYAMPRASGREFSKALFSPRRFKAEFPTWTKSDLVEVAIGFLEKVAYLHSLNIILGDINPKNLQVDANKQIWIIDADSWQIEGFPCPVGTEMFSAPEVIGLRYPDFLRTLEHENFAIATMAFMILITGQFPYARSGSDGDIVRLIKDGNFAFQYKEYSNQDQPAGNWKYMWSHIEPTVKGLFWNTFHREGSRYRDRPTDAEWLEAFRNYRRWLRGPENFDPMSSDVYPTRFKAMARTTPIYDCAECGKSMVGIYNGETGKYATPKLCNECRARLPRCNDCGKPKSSLRDGVCWDCNRKRNFAHCAQCGQEKPKSSLIEGRCYDCNQGECDDCGRAIPKRYLTDGLCDRCAPVACKDCGLKFKKSSLTYGRCAECHQEDVERAARARAESAAKAKHDAELDPGRLCTRCGKPFISRGNVAWHQRLGKTVPTTHKPGYGYTYPPECVPLPTSSRNSPATTSSSTSSDSTDEKKSGGCYLATAVYGSYDCGPVWVLRRWRDSALSSSASGRAFIRAYYVVSPRLVAVLGTRRVFAVPVKAILNRLVSRLQRIGYSDTPYTDN